jgi:hypothetical protein
MPDGKDWSQGLIAHDVTISSGHGRQPLAKTVVLLTLSQRVHGQGLSDGPGS